MPRSLTTTFSPCETNTQPSQPTNTSAHATSLPHQGHNDIVAREDEARPPKKKCTFWQALIDWGNKKCYNGYEIADDLTGGGYLEIPV
jgi:hypothetical protein